LFGYIDYKKSYDMPARSTAQQSLFGQAYAIKTGSLDPSDLNPKYRKRIVELSKSMSKSELEKYASTKHKGLKHHVDEKASIFKPKGPGKIEPFLDTDVKLKKKGGKNMRNLKDYRDWSNKKYFY